MTLAQTGDYETGLEEFDVADQVIPRITIVHKEGEYKDSLSNQQYPTLNIIILGLVKQRVLWHTELDDGDLPMCRSTDHNNGFPNVSDDQPKAKRFPFEKSGFDKADYPADDNDLITVPCSGCQLKEWGSHPDGKRPYCSEQFTLPILYDAKGDGSVWVPAIISFQKTALKPLKAYLSSFSRQRGAAFQAVTQIGLDMLRRGTTDYSVPNFKKIDDTDEQDWRSYSTAYRNMADFLRAAPGSRTEEVDGDTPAAPSSNVAKPPASKTPPPAPPQAAAADEPKDTVDAEVVEEAVATEPTETPDPETPPKAEAKPDSYPAGDDEDELPF